MTRQIIVCDVESTGLGPNVSILEVAAINLETEAELRFVPFTPMSALSSAEPEALAINRFFERRLFSEMMDAETTKNVYNWLKDMLDGNVLAGSNPKFDAGLLEKVLGASPWHHRTPDLATYAAGVLGLPLDDLPGMAKVCELLGVVNEEPHSALGDARATAECFRKLQVFAERNRAR